MPLINFIRWKVGNVNICFGLPSNPFQPSMTFNEETSHLFCSAKQITGFYMKHTNKLKWVNVFSNINTQFLLRLLAFDQKIGGDATTSDTHKMKFSCNCFLLSNLLRAYNLPIIFVMPSINYMCPIFYVHYGNDTLCICVIHSHRYCLSKRPNKITNLLIYMTGAVPSNSQS